MSIRSVLAVALAAVLIVPTVGPGATPAHAQVPSPDLDRVCPAPAEAAVDPLVLPVDLGTTHAEAITCALEYGLVRGFGDGTYRPDVAVTREQLASVVAGWLEVAIGLPLPAGDPERFTDVSDGVHAPAIVALAGVGIIDGRADGTFAPAEPVTRGQLTRVLRGAISYADLLEVDGPLPPPSDIDPFDDVGEHTFAADIASLASTGIVQGTSATTFHPNRAVTRGQVATFLLRAAGYLDVLQRWEPTAITADIVVRADGDQVVVDDEVAGDDGTGDGSVSDTTGGDDSADPVPTEGQPGALATLVLTIDAFDGTLRYVMDVSGVEGRFGADGGVRLHRGRLGENGPAVLELVDGPALDAARAEQGGLLAGTVTEAQGQVRFSELVADGPAFHLVVTTRAYPNGAVRGQLSRAIVPNP